MVQYKYAETVNGLDSEKGDILYPPVKLLK